MADLFHRVSIRKYQEKKVEPEKLDYILRASMAAPSACNQQPWEFYIVEDPEILEELSETTPYAKLTAKAPMAIVTAYRKECTAPAYAQIDLSIFPLQFRSQDSTPRFCGRTVGAYVKCDQTLRFLYESLPCTEPRPASDRSNLS